MTHPISLALIPLLIGLGLGGIVGYYYCYYHQTFLGYGNNRDDYDDEDDDTDDDDAIFDSSLSCSEEDDTDEENELTLTETECEEELQSNHDEEPKSKDPPNEQDILNDKKRDDRTRSYLKSSIHTKRQASTIPIEYLPKHVAVIMDGNRRYGKSKYNSISRGHWDGSKTLIDFAKWCMAEHIEYLTVYAFSTENWNRSQGEINALMKIFCKYCDELRMEATNRGIRVNVLSTETDKVSF